MRDVSNALRTSAKMIVVDDLTSSGDNASRQKTESSSSWWASGPSSQKNPFTQTPAFYSLTGLNL